MLVFYLFWAVFFLFTDTVYTRLLVHELLRSLLSPPPIFPQKCWDSYCSSFYVDLPTCIANGCTHRDISLALKWVLISKVLFAWEVPRVRIRQRRKMNRISNEEFPNAGFSLWNHVCQSVVNSILPFCSHLLQTHSCSPSEDQDELVMIKAVIYSLVACCELVSEEVLSLKRWAWFRD